MIKNGIIRDKLKTTTHAMIEILVALSIIKCIKKAPQYLQGLKSWSNV
jgi:hypothetical protein